MRTSFLALLFLSAACQSTVTVNKGDGGDAGTDAGDSGVPNGITPGDGGLCTPACTAPTPYCASNGVCLQCLDDAECVGQSGPHCDTRPQATLFGTCVECVTGQAGDCGTGEACDPLADNCVAGCNANPGSCATNDQICDPSSGACVDCLGNSDCSGQGSPICNTVTHSCVDCLQPSDCPASSPGCANGLCGQCNLASDCPGTMTCLNQACSCNSNANCPSATPECLPDAGGAQTGGPAQPVCGCTANSQCGSDVCDPNQGPAGLCVAACTSDNACIANQETGTLVCDTATGLCVQCATDNDCTSDSASPYCVEGFCGQCGLDGGSEGCNVLSDGGTPYCIVIANNGSLCAECRTAADCPSDNPGCDSQSFSCGSCEQDSDCPASAPTCDLDAGNSCD